jgi:hypothetical protein
MVSAIFASRAGLRKAVAATRDPISIRLVDAVSAARIEKHSQVPYYEAFVTEIQQQVIGYRDRIEAQFLCPLGDGQDVGPGGDGTGMRQFAVYQMEADLDGASGRVCVQCHACSSATLSDRQRGRGSTFLGTAQTGRWTPPTASARRCSSVGGSPTQSSTTSRGLLSAVRGRERMPS